MKQDPILPSIHVCAMTAPPKRMVPSLEKISSFDYMIGESFVALLLHCLCVLIAFWCMEIPKHDIPFHSTIEVAFEAPVALPIPQDVSNMDESDLQTSVIEPSVMASESLPQTDAIVPISVPQPPKLVAERKTVSSQSQPNKISQKSVDHTPLINAQSIEVSHSTTQPVQAANKNLPPEQRCNAVTKEYPMAAKRRHEQGTARISYQLLADGQVKQVEVVESSGYSDLDHAAVQAVQGMKCQAAASGQPVVKADIPVNFSLNKK